MRAFSGNSSCEIALRPGTEYTQSNSAFMDCADPEGAACVAARIAASWVFSCTSLQALGRDEGDHPHPTPGPPGSVAGLRSPDQTDHRGCPSIRNVEPEIGCRRPNVEARSIHSRIHPGAY